jgi:C1A family cysteine protease
VGVVGEAFDRQLERIEGGLLMPWALANRTVTLPDTGRVVGTGWLPPTVDPRDFTDDSPEIKPLTAALEKRLHKHDPEALKAPPASVDLRKWCSPIEDQGQLGSCTANAGVGVVEYFERRAAGKHLDGSRLFVYKTTRNLLGVTGDTGAWLRNVMAALSLCGVPAERYWAYTDADPAFDAEPPAFVYAVADNFEALQYFAHDPLGAGVARKAVVASVKKYLVAGVPSMFGFWGYGSFASGDKPGYIPLPSDQEIAAGPQWGHAIVAVGYDDALKITNTASGASTKGAFLIRNSWGTTWGDNGYGWMPYDYALKNVAMDFWSLLNMEWIDTDTFFT